MLTCSDPNVVDNAWTMHGSKGLYRAHVDIYLSGGR